MKTKTIFLIALLFGLISSVVAQTQDTENKKPFEFWFGMENRITPIHTSSQSGLITEPGIPVNIDKQLSGTAIFIGLAYMIPKIETYLSFEYAARYDHLYYETPAAIWQFSESINGVIGDYHFRLSKPINTGKVKLIPGVGYSFMNRGTDYRQNDNGGWAEKALNFECFDVSVGIGYKQFEVDFRTYLISENRYEPETGFIILPEIKLMYKIPVF